MADSNNHSPNPGTLLGKIGRTGLGLLQNRGELLLIELQEEKTRAIQLLIWAIGLLFLGIMTMLLLTGTVIFLFPEEYRKYAAIGFTVLYLIGTVSVALWLKAALKRVPFPATLAEVRKDREWLDSLQ